MRGRRPDLGWRRILVATDFSPTARVAQRSAEALARETGAEIVLIHVLETPSPSYAFGVEATSGAELREAWIEEARGTLRSAALRSRGRGARVAAADVRTGKPWFEIVEAVRRHEADLVVLGNSGRSTFERLLLGSTAENVVRHAPVPVLVTRSRPLRALRRVLVPVSFDEGSRAALSFAAERLPRRAEIEAFYAAPPIGTAEPWMPVVPPSIPEITAELRAFAESAGAPRVRTAVEISDSPAASILRRARASKADLILLSTHGRGGLAHLLLGSVAEKIARYADRPVLVLPPPGRPGVAVEARKRAKNSKPARAMQGSAVPAGEVVPRSLGRHHPGPWTGQAHTGRGGPKGRRGGTRAKKRRG